MTPELFRWILFVVVTAGIVTAVAMGQLSPAALVSIATYLMSSPLGGTKSE